MPSHSKMFSSPIWSSVLFGAVLAVCVGLVHLSVIWTRKRRFYKNLVRNQNRKPSPLQSQKWIQLIKNVADLQ